MKRKSILIIGNYPPPFGGVPKHIEYLAPYLVEKGWDVHIFSGGRSGTRRMNGFTVYKPNLWIRKIGLIRSIFEFKMEKGIKLKSFSIRSIIKHLRYKEYILFARRIIEKNNIKIITAYNLFSFGPIGAALSDEYNIPLVITNFGEIYQDYNYAQKNCYLVEYICKTAKKLLAMSRHCAESYKILGLSPKVEVIHYGIDIEGFSPNNDGAKIREKLGINDKDDVVLFVGRLIEDMGLHTLIDAIPKVLESDKKIKFIIIGQEGDLLGSAFELAQKFKENIFVIPNVPLKELPFYYAASTIVAAPTKGDRACGSLAAAEAMATGKPVIASKVGGIPEFVIDGETGILIPPEDPFALRDSILELLQDEAKIKKMGMAGRKRVENYFDKNETNRKLEELFSELTGI